MSNIFINMLITLKHGATKASLYISVFSAIVTLEHLHTTEVIVIFSHVHFIGFCNAYPKVVPLSLYA